MYIYSCIGKCGYVLSVIWIWEKVTLWTSVGSSLLLLILNIHHPQRLTQIKHRQRDTSPVWKIQKLPALITIKQTSQIFKCIYAIDSKSPVWMQQLMARDWSSLENSLSYNLTANGSQRFILDITDFSEWHSDSSSSMDPTECYLQTTLDTSNPFENMKAHLPGLHHTGYYQHPQPPSQHHPLPTANDGRRVEDIELLTGREDDTPPNKEVVHYPWMKEKKGCRGKEVEHFMGEFMGSWGAVIGMSI